MNRAGELEIQCGDALTGFVVVIDVVVTDEEFKFPCSILHEFVMEATESVVDKTEFIDRESGSLSLSLMCVGLTGPVGELGTTSPGHGTSGPWPGYISFLSFIRVCILLL